MALRISCWNQSLHPRRLTVLLFSLADIINDTGQTTSLILLHTEARLESVELSLNTLPVRRSRGFSKGRLSAAGSQGFDMTIDVD